MTRPLRIDFVSDVVCPYCAIGLHALEQALDRVKDVIEPEIHFRPFELNTETPPEGNNVLTYLTSKYGTSPEQMKESWKSTMARAADVGFDMRFDEETRIYNTFDAHRLLHWAEGSGKQLALKHALFKANFTDNRAISDIDVLIDCAREAGLDEGEARAVLESDRFAAEVRADEAVWRQRGISSVPSMIFADQFLISGGQPVEVFEKALREIAAKAAA